MTVTARYDAPATTPADALNLNREQDRYAELFTERKNVRKDDDGSNAQVLGGPAVCVR